MQCREPPFFIHRDFVKVHVVWRLLTAFSLASPLLGISTLIWYRLSLPNKPTDSVYRVYTFASERDFSQPMIWA